MNAPGLVLVLALLGACGAESPSGCPEADQDADGFDSVAFGGEDCDDNDSAVHPGALDAPGWRSEVVATGDLYDPSLAYDAQNVPWLTYGMRGAEGALVLGDRRGGEWSTVTADPDSGLQSMLVVGPDGARHAVSNTLAARPDVHYARSGDDRLDVEVVGAGTDPAVALDAEGRAHVVLRAGLSPDAELLHASQIDGTWTSERIDGPGDTGYGPSIVIDRDGVVHVAFSRIEPRTGAAEVVAASNAAPGWSLELISPGEGPVALVLDDDGELHASFFAPAGSGVPTGLVHAKRLDHGWGSELIDEQARLEAAPSLQAHPRGWLEVAYYREGQLWRASNAEGEWSTAPVGAASDLAAPSLAIGTAGSAIAFRDPDGSLVVTTSADLDCDGVE